MLNQKNGIISAEDWMPDTNKLSDTIGLAVEKRKANPNMYHFQIYIYDIMYSTNPYLHFKM